MFLIYTFFRHWHQYHPKMKKDDYQPSLQKLLRLIREQGGASTPLPDPEVDEKIVENSKSPVASKLETSKSPILPKVEKSKSKLGLRASMTPPTKYSPHETLTPAQLRAKLNNDKRESCKTPGCGYRTSNKEKMAAHRKSLNHYKENENIVKSSPKACSSSPAATAEIQKNEEKEKTCGTPDCSYSTNSLVKLTEHRRSLGHTINNSITPKKRKNSSNHNSTSSSPNKMTKLFCGYKDCEFSSGYLSNLCRHRKRKCHYLTEEDKKMAEAEEKRDSIAKEIEQSQENDTSTDEEEVDVTIPLTKHLSPSKITDYFKPIAKKVKPMQSLESNNDKEKEKSSTETETAEKPQQQQQQEKPSSLVPKENYNAKPVLEQ